MELKNMKRIEWVDIFKALTIISMVIGHATGKYNMFIYQFHMAAFFFSSGYTTKLEKRSVFRTIWDKFYTLIVPLLSIFIVGLGVLKVLDVIGIYRFLFEIPFIGYVKGLMEFVINGNNYVYWLGATWYLVVLFMCIIIQKITYSLFGNKVNWRYIGLSTIIFIMGYRMVRNGVHGQISIFPFDLMCIGQFYFFLGIVFKSKDYLDRIFNHKIKIVIGIIISITMMYYFGKINPTIVDYPSRRFNFIVKDAIAALNGTILIYLLSNLCTYLPQRIKNGLSFIGKNTLGILFFHFMFFKVAFLILYFIKVIPLEMLQSLTPSTEIGNIYWWLFVVISIPLSILLWRILLRIKPIRYLLGQEQALWGIIFERLCKNRIFNKLDKSKLIISINEWYKHLKKTKEKIWNYKIIIISIVVISVLTFSPMLITGIICNDEVQARFGRLQGMGTLIKTGIANEMRMGRPMRIMAAFQHSMSFISSNLYIFRSIQIIFIAINITLFGYLMYKLFNNKRFALFVAISILVFLPITFEHTLPNAFVGLLTFPMGLLLISLIQYINYIQTKKVKRLIVSMLLFFLAMMGYEFIVTFVLLYPIIYYAKARETTNKLKETIKHSIVPIILGLVYLVLMIILQKLVGSSYDGAQLGFVSFKSSFDIISTLFKSSLPGYYLFNTKYQYLLGAYSDNILIESINTLKSILTTSSGSISELNLAVKHLWEYIILNMVNIRTTLLCATLFFLNYFLLKDTRPKINNRCLEWKVLLVGLMYMIIPALPNALSKLYQGNVTAENFTGLPVSYFLYYASMFTWCYLVWQIASKLKRRIGKIILITLISLYCLPIQGMNDIFSIEQNSNYTRMLQIEKLFETECVKNMNNQIIYAPDLYIAKNALAFQDGYWSEFAKLKGDKIQVNNQEQRQDEMFVIYYQNDQYFVIIGGNEVAVLSQKRLRGNLPVQISETEYIMGTFENEVMDGAFYRYSFKLNQELEKKSLIPSTEVPFKDMYISVGTNLKTAEIKDGYYNDGWCTDFVELKIRTENLGKLHLKGYYPKNLKGNERITVYVNDIAVKDIDVKSQNFEAEVDVPANEEINVKLISNFKFQADNPDIRVLSFMLNDLQTK